MLYLTLKTQGTTDPQQIASIARWLLFSQSSLVRGPASMSIAYLTGSLLGQLPGQQCGPGCAEACRQGRSAQLC